LVSQLFSDTLNQRGQTSIFGVFFSG